MMACGRSIRRVDGREYPLWDLIPARFPIHERFAALGYVTVATDRPSLLGPPGTRIRGHEFHESTVEPLAPLPHVAQLLRPDRPPRPDAEQIGGLLAGYAHLHLGSNPAYSVHLIRRGNVRLRQLDARNVDVSFPDQKKGLNSEIQHLS